MFSEAKDFFQSHGSGALHLKTVNSTPFYPKENGGAAEEDLKK
jgi:hypothetical protein